jgi:hypothetical protein
MDVHANSTSKGASMFDMESCCSGYASGGRQQHIYKVVAIAQVAILRLSSKMVPAVSAQSLAMPLSTGAAPLFLSERALEKLQRRKTPPATYNLDLNLVGDYWGWFNKRSYHHTGPVSTFYAMREALAVVAEEGLDNMW